MSESNRPANEEQWHAQFLQDKALSVAADLRHLADQVEHATRGIDRIGTPGQATYGDVAARVHHALAWGFANLNADQVIRHASDADIARIREGA